MGALEANGRTAELVRTPAGVVLRLGLTGVDPAYVDRSVAELLSCSAGRPWQPNPLEPEGWWISRRGREHRAGCRSGPLAVELRLAFDSAARLSVELRWRNTGHRRLGDLAVGLLLDLGRLTDSQITVPGLLYNDNPSADRARPVPRVGPAPGGGFVAEEDRLPIPGVNLEWRTGRARRRLSVFSQPVARHSSDGVVRYGSLGVIRREGPVIAALSGVLMFDGKQDVRYVSKAETETTGDGYLTLLPGESYDQHLVVDWGPQEHRGHAFRHLVRTGRSLFAEPGAKPLDLDEIVARKTQALDSRWFRAGTVAGYTKFSEVAGNGPAKARHFLYGWTGQALKLAWCDARLGFDCGDQERIERCRAAVGFYLAGSSTGTPGLRHNAYQLGGRRWTSFRWGGRPMVSSRAYGETVADLAEIVTLFRAHGEVVPDAWLAALTEALDFFRAGLLPDGTFPIGWRLDGSPAAATVSAAGIPCVLAALKAVPVLDDAGLLPQAITWLSRYHDQHARTFDRPFARSTLDAACEDKEAGMYYFLAAYESFRLTGDELFAGWAEVAADWLLTFVYVWSPELDTGSPLREAGFSAVGWPTVSVQNHHLDVFFPTAELLAFGAGTGRPEYVEAAWTAIGAMGQGIAGRPGEWGFEVVGEQGEAFFQTHWQRRGTSNTWNPSWVIALVLANALRIRDHG
ncbi:hypothetical protein EV644_109172 [Kribbella orskensis]|uniref:Uncharacterized protein n=1 Tax=Kribbella orskensis TaxID=2512216 RepID=A0ABY2BHK1_9ACTN|nr:MULTISPECIES: hypothetical protein [Kribbella]TCN38319.1 hypothetical protein EV642_109104 [Kribbella sp. VKM Ac-2500]TCO20151.1 hypothetical protein EV644_109172 [Kribbella orskensis]